MLDVNSHEIQSIDERRNIRIGKDASDAVDFSVNHFKDLCKESVQKNGRFTVALSGGSTPKVLFEKLSKSPHKEDVPWENLWLFWGDERSAPPTDSQSNYHMAMEAGLKEMPIPKEQIFRMQAEKDIVKKAGEYAQLLEEKLGPNLFDLVMLGMGEDGHTASLFPETKALEEKTTLACANFVPQKNTWRMTLTYPCINNSSNICFYVLGEKKQAMLKRVLFPPKGSAKLPAEGIGTKKTKALWIVDRPAAGMLV